MNNKILALGTYYSNDILYDKQTNILYKDVNINTNSNKNYLVVSLTLFSLPIVRWLTQFLHFENSFILFIVIFLTFILTHSLVKQKFNKLQLEVISLTDYEKKEFLIKEKKNTEIAITIFFISLMLSIICMFIYLLISSIILIFIIFGCSFLVFLTLELSTFERKRIINKLIKEVEIK
ncbi:hypothetical protein DAD66_10445 [Streptococcus agalactiae]|uniref:hypothetical protein n=1 Tax=Streptococcus agalactiae TaxID=1311 RepID=UPI0011426C91|nr:hypothetical protein [Streptococcus agalactiae]TQB90629.1 hypothetical protein DAD74_04095 [Streptococcus agalactiae]TQB93502.1 hypothetical protein DAD73_06035 [Streptococcus agalactiae]TQB97263.1 hypothetical protein DAD71_09475 [Streptococcus agalactiae]TQC01263.1 hypothetical protein DAD66_10445 [Streptococcus agalactiae]TQC04321.1 hypothetical protein DAD68_04915 [Streptococcus agalactiae]